MFCCKDPAAVLGIDITFGLCNLWVTDTSYRNKRLLNPKTGKHPVFLGPSRMRFTKEHLVFSRFAAELLAANPSLRDLRVIGVDMEETIFGGFKGIIPTLNRLLCVKHLSKMDEIKLGKLLVRSDTRKNDQNFAKSEILKDIYGERKGSVYEYGLAEAFDADDLSVKLESLLNK